MRQLFKAFYVSFWYNAPHEITAATNWKTTRNICRYHDADAVFAGRKRRCNWPKVWGHCEQKKRIELLESYLRLANQKHFGASSEQTPPNQGELFNEAEECAEPEQDELPLEETAKPKAKKGRKPFNKKLPRHQVFAYLSEADKADAIDTFFVKVREELDIIPAQVRVLEYMQEKATFKTEDDGRTIKAAAVIKNPVPKAMGSVNLMTYIIISKYADGLPLYRLENIIKSRYGGDITRATMANWVIALAKQAQPLIHLLREYQHKGAVISMDETTIQVLKEQDRAATSKKYMWVSLGGQPDQQSVLFEYDRSRSSEVPIRLLDGYTDGYLQSDGYVSYNVSDQTRPLWFIYLNQIIMAGR